jgi:hypothetical protein
MPKGAGDRAHLRHHARGLAPHHQPARLALLGFETHILRPTLNELDKVVDAIKAATALGGEAAIALEDLGALDGSEECEVVGLGLWRL